jgi:hypothetical protein
VSPKTTVGGSGDVMYIFSGLHNVMDPKTLTIIGTGCVSCSK